MLPELDDTKAFYDVTISLVTVIGTGSCSACIESQPEDECRRPCLGTTVEALATEFPMQCT